MKRLEEREKYLILLWLKVEPTITLSRSKIRRKDHRKSEEYIKSIIKTGWDATLYFHKSLYILVWCKLVIKNSLQFQLHVPTGLNFIYTYI